MAGPYTFKIDRDARTWTAENASGTQIDSGELPLEEIDRRLAIFSDFGVNDPTASALEEIWKGQKENDSDTDYGWEQVEV